MGMTDPISDLLTRMRNAIAMQHDTVDVPASNLKLRVLYILREEGFIRNFKMVPSDNNQGVICVYLKYSDDKTPAITQLQRASKPGRRYYVQASALPRVRHGLGVAIISTSQGVMTDNEATKRGIGGEHICSVW